MHKLKFFEDYQKNTPHPLQLNPFIKRVLKLFPNSLGYNRKLGSKNKIWITFPPLAKCKEIMNREFRQDMFEGDDDTEEEFEFEDRDDEVERIGLEENEEEIPDFEDDICDNIVKMSVKSVVEDD